METLQGCDKSMTLSRRPSRRPFLALALIAACGCGYTTRGLYPETIHTVAVPIFESQGLRRDFEFQLTEAVKKEIEARTPFKIVSAAEADTVLKGKILNEFKAPVGEDGFDLPRGGNMIVTLQVSWVDNRSGEVLNETQSTFNLRSQELYLISLAQTQATAKSKVADELADQIVTMMQAPWGSPSQEILPPTIIVE